MKRFILTWAVATVAVAGSLTLWHARHTLAGPGAVIPMLATTPLATQHAQQQHACQIQVTQLQEEAQKLRETADILATLLLEAYRREGSTP